MNKINFEDLPSTNTPLSAQNLNTLQDNIDNAKVEKETGKGLSANDYTNADKEKVDNMPVAQNNYSTSTTNPYSANYANNTILGTVLYENTTGTTNNLTLSDNIENYDEFEVQSYVLYSNTPVYTNTGKIPVSSAGRVHLNVFFVGANSQFSIFGKRISIVNNNVSVNSDRSYVANVGGSSSGTEGNYTYITKIIGYKNP